MEKKIINRETNKVVETFDDKDPNAVLILGAFSSEMYYVE